MGYIRVMIMAVMLITVPAILESCCLGGCGCNWGSDGPAHYDFKAMSMSPMNMTASSLPRLSEVHFEVVLSVQYTSTFMSGGSALFACSPAPPIANQTITSVQILSDHDLVTDMGTAYSGSDLSFLFSALIDQGKVSLNEVIDHEFRGNRFGFISDAKLTSSQQHKFSFRITLDDGKTFEMATATLNLIAG